MGKWSLISDKMDIENVSWGGNKLTSSLQIYYYENVILLYMT